MKWYGYKVSGGEHTGLHYDASIPLTRLSVVLRYLYNFSVTGNTSFLTQKRLGVRVTVFCERMGALLISLSS